MLDGPYVSVPKSRPLWPTTQQTPFPLHLEKLRLGDNKPKATELACVHRDRVQQRNALQQQTPSCHVPGNSPAGLKPFPADGV